MGRFSRGFALIGSSWRVLKNDPKLLAFPALSLVASVLILAAVAAPFAIWPELAQAMRPSQPGGDGEIDRVWGYVLLFLFYFATSFVVVFFNAALISCVMTRLSGGVPTIAGGLAAAAARLPQIFAWAAVSATVGVILKALEERVPLLGKIVLRLVGAAWAVVTYFVVPAIAVEKLGPFEAIKRSGSLIRQTWGENLAGGIGLAGLSFLLMLPGFGLIAFGVARAAATNPPDFTPLLLAGGLAVAWFIAIGTILSALKQIFVATAYAYAVDGRVPEGVPAELMSGAFRRR
jgi:hypothetical protein